MSLRSLAAVLPLVLLLPAVSSAGRRAPKIDSDALVERTLPSLLGRALTSDRAWDDLEFLCDRIGHRLSGTEALDRAVAWGVERMERGGLSNVHTEEVAVPRWVRGEEWARMLEPIARTLPMLGLGGSVATDGIVEAEVLVVSSFDELTARASEAQGRIVLYDVPFTTYGETVQYRSRGASEAARLGAVASLVRSVTPVSLRTPHTGGMRYADDAPSIPTAAITVEDAATIHRLARQGVTVRLSLYMEAKDEGEVPSANVVGEVLGRERPEEVVVVGCHLDSWDVGQGAQDDGAGCVMALEAGRLIAELHTPPRRTVRIVLYTNEENGLAGGRGYAEAHADALEQHVAALEADIGAGEPRGWRLDVRAGADEERVAANRAEATLRLQPLLSALEALGAGELSEGGAGADVWPLTSRGVPGLGLDMDLTGYWPIHHTEADTLDKIDPQMLRRNVAVVAMTAFWLAEVDGRLVEPGQPVFEPED